MIKTAFISHATVAKSSRTSGVNEDAFYAPAGSVSLIKPVLIAVADGVSNSDAPEQAAAASIAAVKQYQSQQVSNGFSQLVQMAHQQVAAIETTAVGTYSPASTLVSAEISGDQVNIISVGDSRAYLFDKQELTQLTVDDTIAQDMVESGLLELQDRDAHPMSHALTKAIGRTNGNEESASVISFTPASDQILILCTDGVYSGIKENDLKTLIESAPDVDVATQLVQAAVDRQVNDDITAITVTFRK